MLSFGAGYNGRLGHGDMDYQQPHTPKVIEALCGESVVAVTAGWAHSLVLTEAGTVLSFGYGGDGCLGHEDHENRDTPK